MPETYIHMMKTNGYEIRLFSSLDAYFADWDTAHIYYFTRLQLERMWDDILKKEWILRKAITFRKDHLQYVDETLDTFYHPLPRHKEKPVLPSFLDNTGLNWREKQSRNGMFIRIVIVWALLWVKHVITDFDGEWVAYENYEDDFIHEVNPDGTAEKSYSEWVRPIENGMVIDHIGKWSSVVEIKQQIIKIVSLLWLYGKWWEWISSSSTLDTYKWIIFRPDFEIKVKDIRKLAALAPGCTLNRIKDKIVIQKLRLSMPPKLYNFDKLSCKNKYCISCIDHNEHVPAVFIRKQDTRFSCIYCGKHHQYGEVRDI
jgi:aspartate carbamoyltransferase